MASAPHILEQVRIPTKGVSGAGQTPTGMMDLEAGVRLGSLCSDGDGRRSGGRPCPTAENVVAELDRSAAAAGAAPGTTSNVQQLCLFTSLTDAYVVGHEVFMRSALLHAPQLLRRQLPLYVLDQSLSPDATVRVLKAYPYTRLMRRHTPSSTTSSESSSIGGASLLAKDVRTVTKFALNKEKTALFSLRDVCAAVLKIDTGDMLALPGFSDLFEHPIVTAVVSGKTGLAENVNVGASAAAPPTSRPPVWAAQALGQPYGKINGGLMLFGRYWLHNATRDALEQRALWESREQSLFGGFFAGHFAMLPKRFNVEMRFWDAAHDRWRQEQQQLHGLDAVPPDITVDVVVNNATASASVSASASAAPVGSSDSEMADLGGASSRAAVLHFVGRDKPWMRYDVRSRQRPDTAEDLCRRLREKDAETCAKYLETQAMWWRAYGQGRCLIVGDAARGLGQGFVIDSFEIVLRMHSSKLGVRDVGGASESGERRPNLGAEELASKRGHRRRRRMFDAVASTNACAWRLRTAARAAKVVMSVAPAPLPLDASRGHHRACARCWETY